MRRVTAILLSLAMSATTGFVVTSPASATEIKNPSYCAKFAFHKPPGLSGKIAITGKVRWTNVREIGTRDKKTPVADATITVEVKKADQGRAHFFGVSAAGPSAADPTIWEAIGTPTTAKATTAMVRKTPKIPTAKALRVTAKLGDKSASFSTEEREDELPGTTWLDGKITKPKPDPSRPTDSELGDGMYLHAPIGDAKDRFYYGC